MWLGAISLGGVCSRFTHRVARGKVDGDTFEGGKLSITPIWADRSPPV